MRQVSDVARLFGVDRDIIKKWCHEFSDYLSSAATPPKGQTRLFGESDVRVLALIFYYWEDEPDYDAIRGSLNSNEQDDGHFLEFVFLNTPVFREPPDSIETRAEYSIILNGEFLRTPIEVARAYKTAGDALVEQATSNYYPHELDYPIFFNYRHALELYLKILTKFVFTNNEDKKNKHDLADLISNLELQYGAKLPDWMKARLHDFHKIDKGSTTFRYAESVPSDANDQYIWIDLFQLKTVMDVLYKVFEELIGKR